MKLYTPNYYHDFRCIASACPDSCCKEWEVDIDPDTAAFYQSLPGDLGEYLREHLRTTDDGGACMTIENGRCPMWRQDGLCRIQAELGHEALSAVCREYPRLCHDYGDFMEHGLELSCPEAARLILTSPGGILEEELPGGTEPEYDQETMDILRQSRSESLSFLRNTPSIPHGLAAVLLYAYDVQAVLDGRETICSTPEMCLADVQKYGGTGSMEPIFAFFQTLEILTPQWEQRLQTIPGEITWNELLRNLACYLFERYWLQAISDYDLVCRVKFAITACLLVGTLGGNTLETAQLFSKEIENNPDNVEAILDGVYTSPALTDTQLLSLLLRSNL